MQGGRDLLKKRVWTSLNLSGVVIDRGGNPVLEGELGELGRTTEVGTLVQWGNKNRKGKRLKKELTTERKSSTPRGKQADGRETTLYLLKSRRWGNWGDPGGKKIGTAITPHHQGVERIRTEKNVKTKKNRNLALMREKRRSSKTKGRGNWRSEHCEPRSKA